MAKTIASTQRFAFEMVKSKAYITVYNDNARIFYGGKCIMVLNAKNKMAYLEGWRGYAEWYGGTQICKFSMESPDGTVFNLEVFKEPTENILGSSVKIR